MYLVVTWNLMVIKIYNMTEELKISDNSFWSDIEKTFKSTGDVYELFCQY